ncbi:DNA-binding transcriptional regulator, LysR family [Brevibacterium siliguriense]|uniref:DNA-binding transcriptional regulator, LysR family n=1 Tax=Brevibacterium siliguriense TaxID=1136497 RepID=A0A1H1W7R9_9MICO|nr:LysR family transcriptional regulator [Brevibacterium siliguriense]SDS92740.1 DNA-binding transcriptional regulator, LysR family [Brevibacterium siliguriense]
MEQSSDPRAAPLTALRELVELVDQDGHLTEAAAALGIPQSTMSRRLRALEGHLGVPLTVPRGRAIGLTRAALDLVAVVRSPLAEIDAALVDLAEAADPEHGTIRFGFPLTMGAGEVPDLLAAFNRAHPGIRLDLKQAHGAELVADLQMGTLDLAIIIPPPPEVNHEVFARQTILAALPDVHPLAGAGSITLDQLAGEEFIATPATYNLRALTDRWCQECGFDPEVKIEVTEFSTIREFVGRGMGVALIPPAVRRVEGITEVTLDGPDHVREIALCSAVRRPGRVVERLRDFIREHAANWSNED